MEKLQFIFHFLSTVKVIEVIEEHFSILTLVDRTTGI